MIEARLPTQMQRSRGEAAVVLRSGVNGSVRLADLRQAGSAKVLLPRSAGALSEVVFLNTSGGLTGGDRLDYRLTLGAGARIAATTQTAERCYRSTGALARVSVALTVQDHARLDWMPQETILFDGAALHRRTEIALEANASCLLAESLILGRQAMGETLRQLDLTDHRLVTRSGRPIWAEGLRLTDAVLAAPEHPAMLNGARAMALAVLITQGAEDAARSLAGTLDSDGCLGAASGWDGKCVVRLMARDSWSLRRQLARVLTTLSGRALPRVWQMGGTR